MQKVLPTRIIEKFLVLCIYEIWSVIHSNSNIKKQFHLITLFKDLNDYKNEVHTYLCNVWL